MRSDTRNRLLLPIAIPIGILALIGAVLFGFSRILLSVKPHAATATALVVAATVLAASAYAATRERVREATIGGLLGTVAGVAMLAGGIAILAVGTPAKVTPPFAASLIAPDKASIDGYASKTLSFPANRPVSLTFENQEPGVQHDVVIAAGTDQNAPRVFEGAVITGVSKTTYAIRALEPGSYLYFCKIHPATMTGTLTVTGGGGGAGGGGLTVVAQGLKFDTSRINLPGDQASQLTFKNQDPGTQHNIGIYQDQGYTKELFKGEIVTGVTSTTYHIPAFGPGTYFFKCDIHASMNGTVVVAASSPTPPPPTGSPPAGG